VSILSGPPPSAQISELNKGDFKMTIFRTDMSVEEILAKMDSSGGHTETMHAGPCFLQFKLQAELIEKQRNFNEDLISAEKKFHKQNLRKMTSLIVATWALVLATIILAFYKYLSRI